MVLDSRGADYEVNRQEIYLQPCFSSSLAKLVMMCLHTEPDQRPEITTIHMKLKEVKAGITQQMLMALTTGIELFNVKFLFSRCHQHRQSGW